MQNIFITILLPLFLLVVPASAKNPKIPDNKAIAKELKKNLTEAKDATDSLAILSDLFDITQSVAERDRLVDRIHIRWMQES